MSTKRHMTFYEMLQFLSGFSFFTGSLKERAMPISDCEVRDPRVRRTRQLLHEALRKLLREKDFDQILVQDITEAATLNRATFYDHYTDKYALFEAMIGGGFHQLLQDRNISFRLTSPEALQSIIQAVCDYYIETHSDGSDCSRHRSTGPLMESAITAAIRIVLLEGISMENTPRGLTPELVAGTMSGAICGAVKEWFSLPDRTTAQRLVSEISDIFLAMIPHPSQDIETIKR